jgi:integrase
VGQSKERVLDTWKGKLAPGTIHEYAKRYRYILRFLNEHGAPAIRIPRLRRPPARAVVATADELHKLLSTAKPHLRLFMLLYLQCGLRFSEAMAVTPAVWNPATHTVTVPTKTGETRTAEVTEEAEKLLAVARKGDAYESAILTLYGKKVEHQQIRDHWNRHRLTCGVNPELTAHDLRRTAATILYGETKDLRIPMQLLGHKNLASTLAYIAPFAPDEARRYAPILSFDKFNKEAKQ